MEPIYADFSVDPARFGGAAVRRDGCSTAPSHLEVDAGGWVELHFEADGPQETAQAAVTVTALVSKRGPLLGHAPVDMMINGILLVEGHVIPGGDLPVDTAVAVPGEYLVAGTNVLRIQTSAASITRLWVYRITVDTVENRGGAVRAMRRAVGEAAAVCAFSAQRRPAGVDAWQPAPRVLVHIDRGEHAELSQLSWRGEDGAEAAVSFQRSMASFYGHHRAADGAVSEFRGQLAGSWAAPEQVAPAAVHVFGTQEGWGGGWHDSGRLRLLLDDGGADVERVSWRDCEDNSGSVALDLAAPRLDDAVGSAGRAAAHAGVGPGEPGEITGLVTRITASGQHPDAGEIAENLLDGSIYSKWLTFSGIARIDFTLARPTAVGSYELMSANDFPDRDPRDWTLSGSPDGRTWTALDTRSGEFFMSRNLSRAFRIRRPDQGVYQHYRLEISKNAGSTELQLACVRFFRPAVAPALGFLGYYHRAGEGPIGYRGTALATAAPSAIAPAAMLRPLIPAKAGAPSRAVVPGLKAVPAKRAVPARRAVPGKRAVPAEVAGDGGKAAEATRSDVAKAPSSAPTPSPSPLTTVEGWKAYLTEYGLDVVRTMDEAERQQFTHDQLSRGWLGGDPVDESGVAALEERLGVRLPASYRAFVGASDGWRSIGEFMYVMRGIDEIDWFRTAEPRTCEILGDDEYLGPILKRALLISKEGDAQYWFLDPGDVSPDGEWAAYTWSSWGFLSERFPSFAALVADERQSMEQLRGYSGSAMHPDGADELFAEGRDQALRGDVDTALRTLDQAAVKGSGAAAYLKVILGIFLESTHGHHALRNGVFGRPHVMAAVGLKQLRAEAVPLFLHLTEKDPISGVPAYLPLLEDLLPMLPGELADRSQGAETSDANAETDADAEAAKRLFDPNRLRTQLSMPELTALRERMISRVAAFVPPVLSEPPAFQRALDEARALVRAGDADGAWAVIEAALPGWHSDSPTRVAPVVLLIDPVLNTLITPTRSRQIVRVPRGVVE
jgi:lectin domain-containing protein/SMI1/KNR4 family protein SUKH-1